MQNAAATALGSEYLSRLEIKGRKAVSGVHTVPGNKNAALPMIAAALLSKEPVKLTNVPDIADVRVMLDIARCLGAAVSRDLSAKTVDINAHRLRRSALPPEYASLVRTSILFAGPLLARLGAATMPSPGGDSIGHRRLDTHIAAFRSMGVSVSGSRTIRLKANKLTGCRILLDEPSVTGTENILMAAAAARGVTVIYNAACEPHVVNLGRMLQSMGAKISGLGTNLVEVEGADELHGGEFRVGSDLIEAASFITAALVTGGELSLNNLDTEDFEIVQSAFKRFGARMHIDRSKSALHVPPRQNLKLAYDLGDAIPRLSDGPWPMIPSDLVSLLIVLATQSRGTCLFFEKMFESRLYFVDHLIGMGAKIVQCDPHRVVVTGKTHLQGTTVTSPDIRAGMALIIAALCAKGRTVILNAESIDRGYETVEKALSDLGADIKRLE